MSAKNNTGLGKGFAALMPQNFDTQVLLDETEKIHTLQLSAVQPNSEQPRQEFDPAALDELAASIKRHGLLQPIVVTPGLKSGTYTIVAGERRWRASKIAGKSDILAIVRTFEELEQLEVALIENVQRVDLSPIEQAKSIERLHQQFNVTYESIAQRLSKAPSTINNIVRLLQLPKAAFQALAEGHISEGHARAILALKLFPKQQASLLAGIISQGWSVRQAERFVHSVKSGAQDQAAVEARVKTETPETEYLSKRFGLPVQVRRTAKGGRLEIAFKSDEELEGLMKNLSA